jgi:hypothetical protein
VNFVCIFTLSRCLHHTVNINLATKYVFVKLKHATSKTVPVLLLSKTVPVTVPVADIMPCGIDHELRCLLFCCCYPECVQPADAEKLLDRMVCDFCYVKLKPQFRNFLLDQTCAEAGSNKSTGTTTANAREGGTVSARLFTRREKIKHFRKT